MPQIICTPLEYRYHGILRTAEKEFDAKLWMPEKFPIYDMLDAINPDIIMIDLKYITKTIISAIQEHPSINVVLFGMGIPQGLRVASVVAKPSTSAVIRRNIEGDDHKTLYINDSANIVEIFSTAFSDRLTSQVMYYHIGNTETYIDEVKLFAKIGKDFHLKIAGHNKLNIPYQLGSITYGDLATMYKNSMFSVDYHTNQFLDILANGGAPLVRKPIKSVLGDACSFFDTYESLYNIVKQGRTEGLASNIKKAQYTVLSGETCYHRLIDIMQSLGYQDGVNLLNNRVKEYVQCVRTIS